MNTSPVGFWGMRAIGICCVLVAFACSAAEEKPPVEDEVFIRSTADKTLQPARFFAPESAKGKKVPLLVALHTWSYGYESEWPWKWAKKECAKRGWALVYPHFRGSNDKPEACGSDLAVQDIVDAVDWTLPEKAEGTAVAVTK